MPGRIGFVLAAAVSLSLLLSCGAGNFFAGTQTGSANRSSLPPYHAFGDSITMGFPLADPATQSYVALFAAVNALNVADYAIGGDMSCDIPTRQIFANAEQSSTASQSLYSILISTNDIAYRGAGPYEAVFNLCQQASIAWLALPREYRTPATAATTSGATHLETANNWNAIFTDAPGASITFAFTRSNAGPAYLWYRVGDRYSGTFTYTLDGAVLGSLPTSTVPTLVTRNGSADSLALLRIPAISPGAHLLTLTQTGGSLSGMGIVALGLPPLTTIPNRPRLLVGTTVPQNRDGISQCVPNPVPCQLYTADITANGNLIAGDGLDVELFNTGKYMSANTADMADNYHPNSLGHVEMAHAVQDIY